MPGCLAGTTDRSQSSWSAILVRIHTVHKGCSQALPNAVFRCLSCGSKTRDRFSVCPSAPRPRRLTSNGGLGQRGQDPVHHFRRRGLPIQRGASLHESSDGALRSTRRIDFAGMAKSIAHGCKVWHLASRQRPPEQREQCPRVKPSTSNTQPTKSSRHQPSWILFSLFKLALPTRPSLALICSRGPGCAARHGQRSIYRPPAALSAHAPFAWSSIRLGCSANERARA